MLSRVIGGEAHNFDTIAFHAWPNPRKATDIWKVESKDEQDARKVQREKRVNANAAYQDIEADECGRLLLAGKSIAIPFVGAMAASIVLAEMLKTINGGPCFQTSRCVCARPAWSSGICASRLTRFADWRFAPPTRIIRSDMETPGRLMFVEKGALTPSQLDYLQKRLNDPLHIHDCGPPKVWNVYTHGLFAFIEKASGLPIAIAESSGIDWVVPGWWVDSAFRHKGYGKELVDLLAEHLKSIGVKRIGRIRIQTHQGEYDMWSEKLVTRLRGHFSDD